MIDKVKARLREAKLRLTHKDNTGAFKSAYEALDMFLREICFTCGAKIGKKHQKKPVYEWGFAECVDFLIDHSLITRAQKSLLFRINNLRIPAVHYGKDPSEKEIKDAIREIEHFIRGQGICAKALMNSPVIGVQLTDPISKARKLMLDNNYSQLPVLRGNEAVGSISEGTFVRLFPTLDLASEITIDNVMEPRFKEVSENALLEEVKSLLFTESAVLVLSQNLVVGIITKADLLKMF